MWVIRHNNMATDQPAYTLSHLRSDNLYTAAVTPPPHLQLTYFPPKSRSYVVSAMQRGVTALTITFVTRRVQEVIQC